MAKKRIEAQFDENDVFGRLADRVDKAIATIQQLRRERDEIRQKLAKSEEALRQRRDGTADLDSLQEENERFRTERDEVRARLEKLLENLERLEEI